MKTCIEEIAQAGDSFLTRIDLARRWKVSIETIKRRERTGTLTPYKLGRGVRYRVTDVLAIEREAEVKH